MNCQNFENIIDDLAREQMMDTAARADAINHASVCARCSARLSDERMLSAGLRRLAASASAEEAPAHIEAQLLAAFRKQQVAQPSIAEASARRWSRLRGSRLRGSRLRWPRMVAAAAAVILITLAVAAIRFNDSRLIEQDQQARFDQPPVQNSDKLHERAPLIANPKPRSQQKNRPQKSQPRNAPRYKEPVYASANGSNAASEIRTDFIPLMHGESIDSMESGQMIRVELPRSALASFGLPMNMELDDKRIKADVVVGNDGLARAIRFVR